MMLLTGARPDTAQCRERDQRECPFEGASTSQGSGFSRHLSVQQGVMWVRQQHNFPSCVGQAFAAGIDAVHQRPPWVSAVGIWREARRRQGRLERLDLGTRFDFAIEGLIHRGYDEFTSDEDKSIREASKQDDLADELTADDHRLGLGPFRRFRIWRTGADRISQLQAALTNPKMVVVVGAYLRPEFFKVRNKPSVPSASLDRRHFGGGNSSHALRVFAVERVGERYRVALQNSWGLNHGGMRLSDGTWLRGCVWVDESAIGDSDCFHDVHCLEVLT